MADDMDMADDDAMVTQTTQGDQTYDPFDPSYNADADPKAGPPSGPQGTAGAQKEEDEDDYDEDDLEIVINTGTSTTDGTGDESKNYFKHQINIQQSGSKTGKAAANNVAQPGLGSVNLETATASANQAGTSGVSALLPRVGTSTGKKTQFELEIDSMEEKPWRKDGADITDYFNYGFNEETWRVYCNKQLNMRMELAMQKTQPSDRKGDRPPEFGFGMGFYPPGYPPSGRGGPMPPYGYPPADPRMAGHYPPGYRPPPFSGNDRRRDEKRRSRSPSPGGRDRSRGGPPDDRHRRDDRPSDGPRGYSSFRDDRGDRGRQPDPRGPPPGPPPSRKRSRSREREEDLQDPKRRKN